MPFRAVPGVGPQTHTERVSVRLLLQRQRVRCTGDGPAWALCSLFELRGILPSLPRPRVETLRLCISGARGPARSSNVRTAWRAAA